MAAIAALETLKRPMRVDLFTDSQYLRQGITEWIAGWRARGWRTADKKPVKNQDLWERLDAARKRHRVEWRWLKGHAGHVDNERADELAREEIRRLRNPRLKLGLHIINCELNRMLRTIVCTLSPLLRSTSCAELNRWPVPCAPPHPVSRGQRRSCGWLPHWHNGGPDG